MAFHLARYVGQGTADSPYRPNAADEVGEWTSIDLRPDPTLPAGWCLFTTAEALPGHADRFNLGDDPDAVMPPSVLSGLRARLDVNVAATTLRQIVPELLVEHARNDGSRWRPLRAERDGALRIHLGDLSWEQPAVRGGATLTDDFNRASLGATWAAVNGSWGISASTQLSRTGTGSNEAAVRYQTDLDSVDHWCQVDFTGAGATTGYLGPAVRFAASAQTYYAAMSRSSGGLRRIHKCIDNVTTELTSNAAGGGPTRTIKLEANGSTLKMWDAGSLIFTITDTSITTGTRCGVQGHPVSAVPLTGDNWSAEDLGAPAHPLTGALTVSVTTAGDLIVAHPLTGSLSMVTITAASRVSMSHPLGGALTASVTMAGNLAAPAGTNALSGALTVSVTAAATKLRVTNPGPYVVTGWTTTAGSTTITGGTATAADVGATVTGPGIPPGTTIVSVTP